MGVTGIGGFFFRARDPEGLAAWYAENLGVGTGDWGVWEQLAGPSVFQPTGADDEDIPHGKEFRLNFRVDELDALKAALEANGIEVVTKPEWDAPGVGRFARLVDPEGNAIELWEPD
jgi:predicted enzyme related to lactoylglutathione lyase